MDIDKPSVAIYWDFENIHATLIDQLKGSGTVGCWAESIAGGVRVESDRWLWTLGFSLTGGGLSTGRSGLPDRGLRYA
jgi:hypothetical protein